MTRIPAIPSNPYSKQDGSVVPTESNTASDLTSPSNSLAPITPTSESPNARPADSSPIGWDLDQLLDPTLFALSMSPARGSVHSAHSAGYSYSEQYTSTTTGVSQERSTVSPSQVGAGNDGQWPPKQSTNPHPSESNGNIPHPQQNTMLPPLRMSEAGQWVQHHPLTYGYPPVQYLQYPQYPPSHKYSHHHHTLAYPHYYASQPTASTTSTELYTPSSAVLPTQSYPSGTITPSTFQGWQVDQRRGTASGGLSGSPHEIQAGFDRRTSTPSVKEERDTDWSKPVTPEWRSRSEVEDVTEYKQGMLVYTMDAEVKQTAEIKRMCYNCQAKTPPSWRKSIKNPGKILCNKCGIFERTHNRARPPQNDDQKLRKTAATYRRGAPPALQMMRGSDDESSPMHSPYSTVPSQATPSSITYPQFTFSSTHMLPHPASNPLQHIDFHGDPLTPSYRRHPHAHPSQPSHGMTQRHSAVRGQSSPYAHAYYRRNGSHTPTITMGSLRGTAGSPLQSSILGSSAVNGVGGVGSGTSASVSTMTGLPAWSGGRRHSDAPSRGKGQSKYTESILTE